MQQHIGHRNTRHASEKTQDQALREQLPDQTAAAGPQSGSEGHLLPPRRSFGQHQVRHIRAGDQQHQQNRSEREIDRAAQGIAHQQLRERIHREAPILLPGMTAPRLALNMFILARACSMLTPERRRPMTCSQC